MQYKKIVDHYESCFEKHGDSHLGVDWPNEADLKKRFEIMLGVARNDENFTLLDFGCGTAMLKDYLVESNRSSIGYSGLDISEKFIDYCRKKYPMENFYCVDILKEKSAIPNSDYIILNGVFTEKRDLNFAEMLDYFKMMIEQVFTYANKGIAFNVMSKNVDWERDELFHLSLDELTGFLCKKVSRHFIIRNDYGLYEYTVYLYKHPIL